jgi:protein-tyrosine phosphatase
MRRPTSRTRARLQALTTSWPVLTMHLAMGVMFLLLAIVFGALTGFVGGVTWVLLWPALSLLAVGVGYVWSTPWMLGKQSDGTLAWYSALLLMPYFGAAEFAWYLVRVLGGEEPWHEVSRGLFLGRRVQHWELPARIGLVLDMTAEFVEPIEIRTGRKYVCVPTFDASAPRAEALADAIADIVPYRGNIYVHCAAGHGRSAMAMAVLMVARGVAKDLEEAIAMMCAARTRVNLRTTQRRVAQRAIEILRARELLANARAA